MTKKFLALTLVLVLAAGFAAVAQEEDEKALTGSWENDLILDISNEDIDSFNYNGVLNVNYTTGGIDYSSTSTFDDDGFDSQEFGVDLSVGLLDLSSTADFNVQTPSLAYWSNNATMTLGGISISDTFLLQEMNSYGAGMDLMFSGETPGGVSVSVNNYLGMEPVVENDDGDYVGEITRVDASDTAIDSGYRIVVEDEWDEDAGKGTGDGYGGSSFQYVGTMLSLDSLSLGCCDFESNTLFSELQGFEYTEFLFDIEAEDFPITLSGNITFTPDEKTASLVPETDFGLGWVCFTVYTNFDDLFSGTELEVGDSFTIVEGFGIKEVTLGDVEFSSYTALGDSDLENLNAVDSDVPYIVGEDYDEVIRIEKLEKFDLDFSLDTYFDMNGDGGLFDLALFDASASYELSDQFSFGSGLSVSPDSGLGEVTLSLDYSW
ncbi:MAG: hypothetical protein ACOC9A_02620 [Candidatus Bipolaricaulota bacterium]